MEYCYVMFLYLFHLLFQITHRNYYTRRAGFHDPCAVMWIKHIYIYIQAQRRAAGYRSERKYAKKYVFMSKNVTFGPLGHVLNLLNGPPNSYFFIFFFKQKISFIYCHIEPSCQKSGTYGEKCDFWLVRAPFALFKGPPPWTPEKRKLSEMIFFAVFLSHTEPTCQK